ncbi:MAG TPA: tyrosine--tRNA ligase [Gemmatimonadaceae bacterium]|jgi:tyrosyl-tRNA synthetase|nr:tyrosine--tRNA ligase [Gemmatimonadaceae bacterium]
MTTTPLLAELSWRGLLYQHTEGLDAALSAGLVAYCGFDPTAPSLHVGSLVPVMGLVHLQRTGHVPIALVGGGTGMIGDPSGKSTERQLQTRETIEANSRAIGAQLARFLDFSGPAAAIMGDNAEWLLPLGAVEMLRDIGKHFTVNYMLAKESVKARLEGGISFTEFSYMLLQAYDYLQLHQRHGATLQIGGSDQWGNITAGIELIRRVTGHESHALTLPLVTTAGGTKFGKTEAGAVYLDPAMTSPYKFYQFWINADDRDVSRWLRFFTLLDRATIEALDHETREHPERRAAQRTLAEDMTSRVHGDEALRTAGEVSALLFGGSDPSGLSVQALDALAAEIPFARARWTRADASADGRSFGLQEALVAAGLASSKSDARRTIQQGGVSVNGVRASGDAPVVPAQCLHGSYVLLKKGARNYALLRMQD